MYYSEDLERSPEVFKNIEECDVQELGVMMDRPTIQFLMNC